MAAVVGAAGCSWLEPCPTGDSGRAESACFATPCGVGEDCGVATQWLAGSAMTLQIQWREDDGALESEPWMDVRTYDDAVVDGEWSCELECRWSGRVGSDRAQTVELEVTGGERLDSFGLEFERASSLEAKIVRNEFFDDPELERDGDGVSQARRSDKNLEVHLIARDAKGRALRVQHGGFSAQVLPRGEAPRAEITVQPRDDGRLGLSFGAVGEAVLRIVTTDVDASASIELPLRVSE